MCSCRNGNNSPCLCYTCIRNRTLFKIIEKSSYLFELKFPYEFKIVLKDCTLNVNAFTLMIWHKL